jgi:hypothetical protein
MIDKAVFGKKALNAFRLWQEGRNEKTLAIRDSFRKSRDYLERNHNSFSDSTQYQTGNINSIFRASKICSCTCRKSFSIKDLKSTPHRIRTCNLRFRRTGKNTPLSFLYPFSVQRFAANMPAYFGFLTGGRSWKKGENLLSQNTSPPTFSNQWCNIYVAG